MQKSARTSQYQAVIISVSHHQTVDKIIHRKIVSKKVQKSACRKSSSVNITISRYTVSNNFSPRSQKLADRQHLKRSYVRTPAYTSRSRTPASRRPPLLARFFETRRWAIEEKHSKTHEIHNASSFQAAQSTQKNSGSKHKAIVCTEINCRPS